MPEEGGEIIRSGAQGALADIPTLGGHRIVKIGTEEFQLRIIDIAGRVVPRDQSGRHVGREGSTPDDRDRQGWRGALELVVVVDDKEGLLPGHNGGVRNPNPAGTDARGVVCADKGGRRGNQFQEARRPTV